MSTNDKQERRTFLKGLGTAGLIGLSGCTAGGGGDGGSTPTKTPTRDSPTEIAIASAPTPTTNLQISYLRDQTNILHGLMGELGFDAEVQLTWDELSLFMGGKADIAPSVGSIEAARLSVNQNQNLLAHSITAPQHTGLYVQKGGRYDPAEAGGKQEAVDRLVEDDAKFGIGGWGLGTIPAYRLIFEDKYGYTFAEDGDFNVVTADFPTLSRLVADGSIDAGGSGPPYGLWGVRDQVKPLLWNQEELPDIGFPRNTVAIGNGVTRRDFAEEHPEAVAAWFALERTASDHLKNNIQEVAEQSSTQEALHAESAEQAAWILEFRLQAKHSPNKIPATPTDNELTDDYISSDKEALGRAESMGALPSGWEESFGYMKHDITRYFDMAQAYK